MEIIEKKIHEELYIPYKAQKLFDSKRTCFFDIETTGFSRQKDSIILIGLLYYEDNCIVINQLFANNPKEETLILSDFKSLISKFECYVTYNGDVFDIPFLNYKYKSKNYDFQLNKSKSIDLLKIVRTNKHKLGLTDCKLKTVEKFLDLHRDDKITGKESVELYKKYIKTKDEDIKEKILMHNHDDIYYLPKILKLFDYIDEKMNYEFCIKIDKNVINLRFNLNDIIISGDVLSIKGSTSQSDIAGQAYYGTNYTFMLDNEKSTFNLRFDMYNGYLSNGKKCLYIDKDDYSLNIITKDKTNYILPENIIIIKEEHLLIYDNIISIVKEMICKIFK